MSDFEADRQQLAKLLEDALDPPQRVRTGAVRRALRGLMMRAGRARAHHQLQIDRATLQALSDLAAGERGTTDSLRADLDATREWLRLTNLRGEELGGNVEALLSDQGAIRDELSRLARLTAGDVPLYGPHGLPLERFDAGLGGEVVGFRDGGADVNERLYLGFEGWFRGSEAAIRERQRAYLPLLAERAGVLDVGCGRGEFLEALKTAGIEAEGIDLDPAMVERCRTKGLRVQQADAISFLDGVADQSLGGVFAAQVIEHLSYEDLLRFLRACTLKLGATGLMIIETVNPHSPQALKHFWIDPTHRNPLFPETILSLCRLVGFAEAYVWYPQGTGDPDRDRGEQGDYAVVATAAGHRG